MRRPRGPGGRFLTADEIAAQKAAQAESSFNADRNDEEPQLSLDQEQHLSPPDLPSATTAASGSFLPDGPQHQQSAQPSSLVNIGYHRHHVSVPQSLVNDPSSQSQLAAQTQTAPMYSAQPARHPPTISTPYPVQMHHVPHPHAHARHHHSSFPSYAIYPHDSIPQNTNLRPHEMIQFGGPSTSSS